MKKQIRSAFDEIKAEQQLKTDTKCFLYEFYNKEQHKSRQKLILAPLSAVLVIVLSLGIFATAVPVSAVSFDVENTSVELELNSLNRVLKVNCFGESDSFSQMQLKNLNCENAVALIIEKAKSENADIASAILTINCKNGKKAKKLADTIADKETEDITVTCITKHGALREEAHFHGISTGKYQAYLTLKEYEPDLKIEEIKNLTMSQLKDKISCHSHSDETKSASRPHKNSQHEVSTSGNGKHHGQNK